MFTIWMIGFVITFAILLLLTILFDAIWRGQIEIDWMTIARILGVALVWPFGLGVLVLYGIWWLLNGLFGG